MNSLVIKTSSKNWMEQLSLAYKVKTQVQLVDDAQLGIDPLNMTILEMGRKANLTVNEWIAVLVALGMASVGAWLIVMAVIDPEPWSKVTFALGGGIALTFGGGFAAVNVLTGIKPPHVSLGKDGFEIKWAKDDLLQLK